MQFSQDIKIYPFPGTPGYLMMYSKKRGIPAILCESYYNSIKKEIIPSFDEYCLLMNGLISEDRNKPFRDVLVNEFPKISIPEELELMKVRLKQFILDEYQTPDMHDLSESIDRVIIKYFHDRLKPIDPPSREKIIISYRNIDKIVNAYVYGKMPGKKRAFVEEAYFAAAAIRQLDDFIDKVLWPNLSLFHPKELTELYSVFLKEWLETVRLFDPEMPDEIIEIFLIEMDLALNCSQENFDEKFKQLFKSKSLDVFYVHQKIHKRASRPIPQDILFRLALIDYIRDFLEVSIEADTDLNLYKYIRDHKLDPGELVAFLIRLYEKEDPVGSKIAKTYIAEQSNPVVIELQKAGFPVFVSFPKFFARVVICLEQLCE